MIRIHAGLRDDLEMLEMTSSSVTVSVVAGRPQLSISELYQKFVDHYGTTLPWKQPNVVQLQRQKNRLRAMPTLSRRRGRHATRGDMVDTKSVVNRDEVKKTHRCSNRLNGNL